MALEGTRSSKTNNEHDNILRNTLCPDTPSFAFDRRENKEICNPSIRRHVIRNKKDEGGRDHRKGTTRDRVLVQDVSYQKDRWEQTPDFQPSQAEPLPQSKEISINKPVKSTKILTTKRFHVQNRSFSSLPSCTCKKEPSQVLIPELSRHCIPDDLLTHGSCQCPVGILPNIKLDCRRIKSSRNESYSVPGRFSLRTSREIDSSKTCPGSNRSTGYSGVENKLEKVCHDTYTGNRVFRNNFQYGNKYQNLTQKQSHRHKGVPQESPTLSSLELGTRNVSSRKAAICSRSSPSRSSSLQTAPKSKSSVEGKQSAKEVSLAPTGDTGVSLVVGAYNRIQLYLPERTQRICDDRRLRHRVGYTSRTSSHSRRMESNSEEVAYKPPRTLCRVHSPEKIQTPHAGQGSNVSGRQPHCNSLSAPPGRDKIGKIIFLDKEDPAVCRTNEFDTDPLLHTRKIQYNSGSIVARIIGDGLASEGKSNTKNLQSLGYSANRFVCDVPVQSSSLLCNNRCDRQPSTIHKRIQQGVGIRPSLGVSSATSNTQGHTTPQPCARNIFGGSSEMVKSLLEDGSQGQGVGTSHGSEEFSHSSDRSGHECPTASGGYNDFGGLEDTGWNSLIRDMPLEDVYLLQSAWRSSTWKTYGSAWKDWIKWCRLEKVLPNNPTPYNIARYLSYLFRIKKAAYNTILVKKSVVAMFSNPEQEQNFSKHPLVKSMLKAISLKSSEKLLPRQEVWNIQDLIGWIRRNQPEETSIYQVSRYCAILLLLASGRRLHDLTLLRVDEKHCRVNGDSITFWPAFGSKTDREKQRQSGWLILMNQDPIFNIVKWVNCLIKVSSDRRKACPGLANLFITSRGKVKPASRAVIAGWLKPIFRALGLEVAPGSIRSAVASYNFENNLPLDDLLKRGNWRGAENFFKHYYKSVSAPSLHTDNVLLNSFAPV